MFLINEAREDKLKPIHQNFGDNFKTNITERNRAIIRNTLHIVFLRNEGDESFTPGRRESKVIKKYLTAQTKRSPMTG